MDCVDYSKLLDCFSSNTRLPTMETTNLDTHLTPKQESMHLFALKCAKISDDLGEKFSKSATKGSDYWSTNAQTWIVNVLRTILWLIERAAEEGRDTSHEWRDVVMTNWASTPVEITNNREALSKEPSREQFTKISWSSFLHIKFAKHCKVSATQHVKASMKFPFFHKTQRTEIMDIINKVFDQLVPTKRQELHEIPAFRPSAPRPVKALLSSVEEAFKFQAIRNTENAKVYGDKRKHPVNVYCADTFTVYKGYIEDKIHRCVEYETERFFTEAQFLKSDLPTYCLTENVQHGFYVLDNTTIVGDCPLAVHIQAWYPLGTTGVGAMMLQAFKALRKFGCYGLAQFAQPVPGKNCTFTTFYFANGFHYSSLAEGYTAACRETFLKFVKNIKGAQYKQVDQKFLVKPFQVCTTTYGDKIEPGKFVQILPLTHNKLGKDENGRFHLIVNEDVIVQPEYIISQPETPVIKSTPEPEMSNFEKFKHFYQRKGNATLAYAMVMELSPAQMELLPRNTIALSEPQLRIMFDTTFPAALRKTKAPEVLSRETALLRFKEKFHTVSLSCVLLVSHYYDSCEKKEKWGMEEDSEVQKVFQNLSKLSVEEVFEELSSLL